LEALFEQNLKEGRITFTKYTPINMIIGFIIQIFWSQMLDLSFLPMNSFLAISITGIP
jgi:hypothetical protein